MKYFQKVDISNLSHFSFHACNPVPETAEERAEKISRNCGFPIGFGSESLPQIWRIGVALTSIGDTKMKDRKLIETTKVLSAPSPRLRLPRDSSLREEQVVSGCLDGLRAEGVEGTKGWRGAGVIGWSNSGLTLRASVTWRFVNERPALNSRESLVSCSSFRNFKNLPPRVDRIFAVIGCDFYPRGKFDDVLVSLKVFSCRSLCFFFVKKTIFLEFQ